MSDTGKSVPDLLGDLVHQTSTLVRKEVQLARAELGEKVSVVGGAATSLGAGVGLLLGALFALTYALIALLVELFGLSETGFRLHRRGPFRAGRLPGSARRPRQAAELQPHTRPHGRAALA
jgi:hypothetical protein